MTSKRVLLVGLWSLGIGAALAALPACSSDARDDDAANDAGSAKKKDAGTKSSAKSDPVIVAGDAGKKDASADAARDGATDAGDASVAVVDTTDDTDASASPTLCPGPLAAGDLRVVELMVSSRPGAGDSGEWIEIVSTRACTLDLTGLEIASPRGSGEDVAVVATRVLLPPGGRFLVADAASGLPGTVVTFAGSPVDVLANGGDSVTVRAHKAGGAVTTIDAFAYGAGFFSSGFSVSFPDDCAASERSSPAKWQDATRAIAGGVFFGTPNAPNDDVSCP